MIRHIVFFNFKDEADGKTRQEIMLLARGMLEGLLGKVPTLLAMSAGPNTIAGPCAWDFALVADFVNTEGLRLYIDHPEHKKVSEFMSRVRVDRACVDFEF